MAQKARCEMCEKDFPSADALAMHNSAKHPIQMQPKKSNKKMWLTIAIIALMVILGYFLLSGKLTAGNTVNNPDSINNPSGTGDIQKITLGFNGNYFPNTIKVKQSIPVEITLDNSVRGCFRTFVIRDLGVRKTSSNPSDVITFTPDKKGTFIYACGMHMGTGTIIVE